MSALHQESFKRGGGGGEKKVLDKRGEDTGGKEGRSQWRGSKQMRGDGR